MRVRGQTGWDSAFRILPRCGAGWRLVEHPPRMLRARGDFGATHQPSCSRSGPTAILESLGDQERKGGAHPTVGNVKFATLGVERDAGRGDHMSSRAVNRETWRLVTAVGDIPDSDERVRAAHRQRGEGRSRTTWLWGKAATLVGRL